MAEQRRGSDVPGVGSKVKLSFGGREVVATVIEDRGPLGHGGRQLSGVRLDTEDGGEAVEFELPAADVRFAA